MSRILKWENTLISISYRNFASEIDQIRRFKNPKGLNSVTNRDL